MDLVGGTIVASRFRLVRELGHGGMGSVWLASDTSLDTPCAIKFILGPAAQDPQMRARFEREAKSAAQLRSPNVVQILDHGVSDQVPYIAMELLEGEDLDQRLQRVKRLSPHETVYIMSQVAKALMRANAAGLVHRDLKPANIFLVRDEDRDIPKVLDFGVAKSTMPELADSSTKTGALMGTPYYMSPEQTRGTKALDHRSDLWALAVIVFQCVTGRLPFLSESLGDLLFKIGTDPLPVPSQVAPDLPQGFDGWWARAAQRDPAQRYQTAKEFVEALALAFGMAQSGGFASSGQVSAGSGSFHAPRSPSGMGPSPSGGWGGSQSGQTGQSSPALSAPGVIGGLPLGAAPLTGTGGVTATSIPDKGARRGGAGLVIGIIGAVAVAGAVGYSLMIRGSQVPAVPTRTAVAAGPEAPTAATASQPSTAAVPPPVAPPVVTVAAAVSAVVPPADSQKLTVKPVPGVKPKPSATAVHPTTKIVPNDGI